MVSQVCSSSNGTVVVNSSIGYSTSSVSSPDGIATVNPDSTLTGNITLKQCRVNPTPGIALTGFSRTGNYLISYDQDFATGTVHLYGDYLVSGSTFPLDYASQLYASTATTPLLMLGVGGSHSAAVNSTNDINAVSQLILITYHASDTKWHVTGSSTPGDMCTISGGAGGTTDCPTSSPQFNLTVNGSSPNDGDFLDFALISASKDSGLQKQLLFGASSSTFNNGRSKMTVAPNAGFHAVGQSAVSPSIISLLGGGTYYTFVDSGPFTVQYASFTSMDESGIQLSNSGPFAISNSVFDYPGSGLSSTSTLITLNNVTNSTITLVGVTYSSSTRNTYTYNYNIVGSSTGVQWTNQSYNGTLTGAANTEDDPTQQNIIWQTGNACQTVNSQATGSWSSSSTWDSGFIPTACNAVNVVVGTTVTLDIPTATASTTTITGQLSFSRVTGLAP